MSRSKQETSKTENRKRRRFVLSLILALLTLALGTAIYEGQAFARRALPPYLAATLSEAMGRPVTVGPASFWPIGAFTLRDIRVLPQEGEANAPLTASKARAYVGWIDLLIHHRIRVKTLELDGVSVRTVADLRKKGGEPVNTGTLVEALRKLRLEQIRITRADVAVETIQQDGTRQPITVSGLKVDTDLRRRGVAFRIAADRWTVAGLTAENAEIRGRAIENRLEIRRSNIRFAGGSLAVNGTVVSQNGTANLVIKAQRLPLRTLAPQLGLPKEWDVNGAVDGTVTVSALSGELSRMQGKIAVAPGSVTRARASFPWQRAVADVDWNAKTTTLRNINIEGEGVRLTGSADVAGAPAEPFLERNFTARGRLDASSAKSVAQLAALLAFNTPVPGERWQVGSGHVDFTANGKVGNLRDAKAAGKFAVNNLMLRPMPEGNELLIQSLTGDLERQPNHLRVTNLTANAEGLTAKANVVLALVNGIRPGTVRAEGQVDMKNLIVLRQQLPKASFWEYISPALPASQGRLSFALNGPATKPLLLTGTGGIRLQNFEARVPVGRKVETTLIQEVTSGIRLAGTRLALSGIKLRSASFSGSGSAVVSDLGGDTGASGSFRLISDRWTELPVLRERVPAGLRGGRLALDVSAPAAATPQPVKGTVSLSGARYSVTRTGRTRTFPVQVARANFVYDRGDAQISDVRVVTPELRGSGTGSLEDGRIRARGTVVTSNASGLLRWWTGRDLLDGGRLTAKFTGSAPASDPATGDWSARLRLVDATPKLPAGALPFRAEEAGIRSLTALVAARNGRITFDDAVWVAPSFRATGSGSLVNEVVDGRIQLSTRRWKQIAGDLARSLPVEGGVFTANARINAPVSRLATTPVTALATLRGARLASDRNASVPIQGGSLDLRAELTGPMNDLGGSVIAGNFSLRNLPLPALQPGAIATRINTARGDFRKSGTTVELRNLTASAPGAHFTGTGDLLNVGTGQASHTLQLGVSGHSLATLLPAVLPLPGKAAGGKFNASLVVRGTAADRLRQVEGRAEVIGGEWMPPGQTVSMPITRMRGRFVRTGTTAVIDETELLVPGGEATLTGTMTGLGMPFGPRHMLSLNWRLEDASAWATRMLPVPGWFVGGLFTGHARVAGRGANPAETASGQFRVDQAGFKPLQPFLGGPIRPVSIRFAKGEFTRGGGRTHLKKLELNTEVGTATGEVTAADSGNSDIRMRAEITRLETLVDLWPSFKDRIAGGRGTMRLSLSGPVRRPADWTGDVVIAARDGAVTVEDVDELYSKHPFDVARLRMVLAKGGAVRMSEIHLRGPKANLDGTGTVTSGGRVDMGGKAWFTADFTKKIVKPSILYPLAKLVGHGKAHSRWEVEGTLKRARLEMGITKSLLWKLGKKKVPEPLRDIATGKTPLWSVDGQLPKTASR